MSTPRSPDDLVQLRAKTLAFHDFSPERALTRLLAIQVSP
jgi:hypothetical protein